MSTCYVIYAKFLVYQALWTMDIHPNQIVLRSWIYQVANENVCDTFMALFLVVGLESALVVSHKSCEYSFEAFDW